MYDITVGYLPSDDIPQKEKDIAGGNFPDEIHFHVERYSADSLPRDDEGL